MGRKWKRNKKNKHTGEGKPRKENDDSKYGHERDPYVMVKDGNFKMEAFYAYQGFHDHRLDEATGTFVECQTDEEKEEERIRWLNSLKAILPASFRIGNDVDPTLRERLERELDEYVGKEMEITIEPKGIDRRRADEKDESKVEKKMIAPAKKITYVPHAYQLSLDRQTIRRNTNLNPFHEWLKIQTEAGFITRQETVSMIPPVVLDPKRDDLVLDMCAAPGSKTSQLLEIVNLPAKPHDTEPTGVIVANDADAKRAYMLVHQIRRINSPAVFITNCDAKFFPLIRSKEHPTEGIFDRILCDVPCSGDGTTRKNPGIWKRWNQLNSIGLHTLQLSIALKGARLTKVGGFFCYSTCSMNPMENESVVAELLRSSEGSLELVDKRPDLPGLVSRPGMTTWRVLCEPKSKRNVKDFHKKHSAKMKARRKAWEEKNKAQETTEMAVDEGAADADADLDGDADADAGVSGENETRGESEENETPGESGENETPGEEAEAQNGEKSPVTARSIFEPTTFDEAELKKAVESVGLIEYKTVEEVPQNLRKRIRPSCFPPTKEESEKFKLDRCMRVMPQDMNTGAFFVALLKKVAPMNAHARERFENLEVELTNEDENETGNEAKSEVDDEAVSKEEPEVKKARIETDTAEENDTGKTENEIKDSKSHPAEKDSSNVVRGHMKKHYLQAKDGKKHETLGRDDFVPVSKEDFEPLKDYYGFSSETLDEGQIMVRAGGDTKKLYFVTKTVKKLIDEGIQERLTFVSSGLKGFVRNNKDCKVLYRIAQEGVHFIAPHMTKRKIGVDIKDFKTCLSAGTVALKDLSEEAANQIRPLDVGSFVMYLNGFMDDYIKKLDVVMWRCRGDNVNPLINQAEMDGMKSKLRSSLHEDEDMAIEKVEEAGGKETTS